MQRIVRQGNALFQAAGMVGGVKRSTSIEHDHFRRFLTVFGLALAQGITNQFQRSRRALDRQAVQALALHAQVFWLDPILCDLVVLQFRYKGRCRQTEFVQAILRMHHQHMLAAKALQDFSQWPAQRLAEYAHHLMFNAGRIRKRAKHVEHRAQAQITSWAGGVFHRTVMGWANMKPMPTLSMQRATWIGVRFR